MSPQTTSSEPEPPQPGHLVRTATLKFMRATHIYILARLGAWSSRAKRQNISQKNSPRAKSVPTGKPITDKLVQMSFSDYQDKLKGHKEVLMAFYENEKVPPFLLRGIYIN